MTNWISEIPFGLVLCRVNGEDVSVTALSENGVRVRMETEAEICALSFSFLKSDFSGFDLFRPENWSARILARDRFSLEIEILIPDGAFRRYSARALHDYARYIRLKAEGDDEYLSHELTGCPYEDAEAETLDVQKEKWFSALPGFSLEGEWELALSLDRPEWYEAFLNMDFGAFQGVYLKRNHLTDHALFAQRATRVYIGNGFCAKLCPGENGIYQLVRKAKESSLSVTAVLPPVRENRTEWAKRYITCFDGFADELVVNDPGAILLGKDTAMKLALGVLMNRRRKDPRMKWKSGDKSVLTENSLNDEMFQAWLARQGIVRTEYETCGYDVKIGAGRASVHMPFYQTNTSHDCPLAAACLGLDAGRSVPECRSICLKYARVYPDWLKLVGRYNSLFGLDMEAIQAPHRLEKLVSQGVDRIVLNLL